MDARGLSFLRFIVFLVPTRRLREYAYEANQTRLSHN
jgi:hypothetical protein